MARENVSQKVLLISTYKPSRSLGKAREKGRRKMAKPRTQFHKFFKVYLPNQSSPQLDIPPAFIRHFNGTIPKNAVLKNCIGKLWLVNLEEAESRLAIKKGWQCFASENSLEFGDFLTFEYDGKYLFDVEIFGRNGCQKAALPSNMTTSPSVNEEGMEEVEILSACTTKQKDSKSSVKRVKNLGLAEASRYETNLGEGRALKATRYVTPKGPYFVTRISRWMKYAVYIPKSLVSSYGIKVCPKMVLLDQNGKKWPVIVSFRTDGRAVISHGWDSFRKEHNLQIGDECVFEVIIGRGKLIQKLHVQVIRRQSKPS